jgi:hypothetical protein
MADPVEKTPAGATRAFFGSLGFILLTVGVEAVTGAISLPLIVGVFLLIFAVPCIYAAVFWEGAKRWMSTEAQERLAKFAQHPATRFGMLFLVLETLILSPFIEQRRWPFSYPADPTVYAEKSRLEGALTQAIGAAGREKELADKWRFATTIKQLGRECRYQVRFSDRAFGAIDSWNQLFQMGGWIGEATRLSGAMQPGIILRISNENSPCAAALQRALADIYPNPPSRISINQQTPFLGSCGAQGGQDCVQIEIDY